MPFSPYRNVIDPYDLAAAQESFDVAWPRLLAEDPYDIELARRQLAKWIVDGIVEAGINDPARLKAHALAGFEPRRAFSGLRGATTYRV